MPRFPTGDFERRRPLPRRGEASPSSGSMDRSDAWEDERRRRRPAGRPVPSPASSAATRAPPRPDPGGSSSLHASVSPEAAAFFFFIIPGFLPIPPTIALPPLSLLLLSCSSLTSSTLWIQFPPPMPPSCLASSSISPRRSFALLLLLPPSPSPFPFPFPSGRSQLTSDTSSSGCPGGSGTTISTEGRSLCLLCRARSSRWRLLRPVSERSFWSGGSAASAAAAGGDPSPQKPSIGAGRGLVGCLVGWLVGLGGGGACVRVAVAELRPCDCGGGGGGRTQRGWVGLGALWW